jgi:uncharacterized protein (TIGR00730 family)
MSRSKIGREQALSIKSVGVFCASSNDVHDDYLSAAAELGRSLALAGWTTVYGGAGTGLMGALARGAMAEHGAVVGVRPTFISNLEGDQLGLDELIMTRTMHERVGIMFEKSDAFVTLAGACGTLDEVIQAVTWKRLGLHNKAVVVLNTNGYFDALFDMFRRMVEERFVGRAFLELYHVCDTVGDVMDYLRAYQPPPLAPI